VGHASLAYGFHSHAPLIALAMVKLGSMCPSLPRLDYHVAFDEPLYSVPYALVHEEVSVRATSTSIEVLHEGRRVASHRRSHERARHTTIRDHMPSAHRAHAEWTPSRILTWAETIGPATRLLCDATRC
jgi:transposase